MFTKWIVVFVMGMPALLLLPTTERFTREVLGGRQEALLLLVALTVGATMHLVFHRSKTYRFFSSYQHERAHLWFSVLMFSAPKDSFSSRESSSQYSHDGIRGPFTETRRFLISIAPHWFSPYLIIPLTFVALEPPASPPYRFTVQALIGFCLLLPLTQIGPKQTDLTKYGFLKSLAATMWLWGAQFVVMVEMMRANSVWVGGRVYENAWHTAIACAAFIGNLAFGV